MSTSRVWYCHACEVTHAHFDPARAPIHRGIARATVGGMQARAVVRICDKHPREQLHRAIAAEARALAAALSALTTEPA